MSKTVWSGSVGVGLLQLLWLCVSCTGRTSGTENADSTAAPDGPHPGELMVDVVRDYRGKFLAEDTTLSIVITTADTATDCAVYVASYFTRSLCVHSPYVRVDDEPVFLDLDGSCSLAIVAGLSMLHDSCPEMTEETLDVYDPPVWTFSILDGRMHFVRED